MPYASFNAFARETAARETRVITVFDNAEFRVPCGQYVLQELYCDEDDCDCRRVLIHISNVATRKVDAVISYGWEPLEFYEKWMHTSADGKEGFIVTNFKGPDLAMMTEQSNYAHLWLQFFKELIAEDTDYAKRLQRHYKIARAAVKRRRKVR